jgi:glycosyltransferase involved in cell wall biosynthesis
VSGTPLRIGIDLFPLVPGVGRGGGFQRYAVELLRALAGLDDAHRYVLFVNLRNAHLFPSGGRFTQVVAPLAPEREVWPLRLAWQHLLLPRQARHLTLDVLHSPFDTAPMWLPCPSVVTVHDVITDVYYPAHFPGEVSFLKARYLFHAKRYAARRAHTVICMSRATADEVVRYYGTRSSAVRVVPLGVDHFPTPLAAPSPPCTPATVRPYILSVVSLSPHKNVCGLLEAFRRARERFNLPHELHLVGMPGTGARRVQRALDAATATGLPVRALGYVSEERLHTLYEGASLLVFVPLVEGFGLPPLEAMALEIPVVASSVGSVSEVCGDAAILVPPGDPDAVAEAIGSVLTNQRLADRLRVAGRVRARQFTWEATARATRDVYETAAQAGRSGMRP